MANRLYREEAYLEKLELLPFRKLCLPKYEQIRIPFPLRDTPEASEQGVAQLQKLGRT